MTMKFMKSFMLLIFSIALTGAIQAQSVLDTWISVDDKTGEEKAEIVIEEVNGVARGYIKEILTENKTKKCTKCKGEKYNQPYEGLEIIWGFKKEKEGKWVGGEILDPENGKIYRCKMTTDGPDLLDVRGYIGTPLFGRTQTWKRKK